MIHTGTPCRPAPITKNKFANSWICELVESYLPVYESVRHWKDRRVRELPLFPGYLFVRLPLCDRLRVLRTANVVRIVGFGGQAVALPDHEIETLRRGLTRELGVEPYLYSKVGRRVRVTTGPLQGLEGILVRKKNRSRFVISLDLIMRSVAVEIDVTELEPIHGRVQSARIFAGI